MEIIEIDNKIDIYKSVKKIKKKEYLIIVDLILKSYNLSNDSNALANRILQFPVEICEIIFVKHRDEIGDIKLLINNLKINNLFIDNKNDCSFDIACKLLSLFINENIYLDEIYDLFNSALLLIDKGKSFNNKVANIFNKYILLNEKCKTKFFNISFISWSRSAKERISNFIKFLETKNMIDLCTNEMQEWLKKNNCENQNRFPIIDGVINKLKNQIVDAENLCYLNIIINNIKIIETEINCLNEKLRKEKNESYELSVENTRLKNKIIKIENDLLDFKNEEIKRIAEIDAQRNYIEKLDKELESFNQMAGSVKDNEIFTLKNNIGNALKDEYEKYLEIKESEFSNDLFEVFKARFFRIFTTLKRFGINLENK